MPARVRYSPSLRQLLLATLATAMLCPCLANGQSPPEQAVSFNRDIRPILAGSCIACHGPDEDAREADLRLDLRESAIEAEVIVPGKPDESTLIERIESDDPDIRMPPQGAHEQLSEAQRNMFRQWIASGAEYQPHWAFVAPVRPKPPNVADELPPDSPLREWSHNEIDHFVLHRLLAAGLQPSSEADRYTLVRRVYLDLIGMPPTVEQADAFVNNDDPQAYKKLVESLLASPKYGERWARPWLDLARYADTNGYEKDRPRSIWPYRDWVIRALNADMPYDQFTIEQLAGDMLPDATPQQRIATGFHRNTMLNEEGGIDPLEFRFYAMVDRVATTGTVWLGLTVGCAQCHTHKYDPITHTEYYGLMALLNNADEPDLRIPDPASSERRAALEKKIADLESRLPEQFPPDDGPEPEADRRRRNFDRQFQQWLTEARDKAVDWQVIRPAATETNLPRLETLDDGSLFSTGDITKRDLFTLTFDLSVVAKPVTALRLEVLPDERLPAGGPGRAYYEGRKGDFFLSEISATLDSKAIDFASASHTYGKISIGSGSASADNVIDGEGSTGWSTSGREGKASHLVLTLKQPLAADGTLAIDMLFERHFAASLGRFRWSLTSDEGEVVASQIPADLQSLLATDDALADDALESLRTYYAGIAPELAEARKPIDALRKQLPGTPTTMVFQERPADNPRPTHRHHRGEYLSEREAVAGGVPSVFPPLPENAPKDRLALARWLVSERNPLAARVAVNRAWRSLFGAGLMRTSGDFGTQSDPPTHPELLDWLACEFVELGWSQKALHRLIVTSATYRQASNFTPVVLRQDPANRLLARGPRHRLEAEVIRDSLLQASDLLSAKMYGPSVYPPQPASVTWLAYGNSGWKVSTGEDRYRRSLYTFSKRTAPFAAYTVFDAPTGESCAARRDRSNTPLQALTLLNDEAYLEMAQALAADAVAGGGSDAAIATAIFRRLLTRPPTQEELEVIVSFFNNQRKRLVAGELDEKVIAKNPKASAEQAAWVMLTRGLMNLDETITKQ